MYVTINNYPYKVYKREGKYYIMKNKHYQKVNKQKIKYGSPAGSAKRHEKPVRANLKSLIKTDKILKKKVQDLRNVVHLLSTGGFDPKAITNAEYDAIVKAKNDAEKALKDHKKTCGTAVCVETDCQSFIDRANNDSKGRITTLDARINDLTDKLDTSENEKTLLLDEWNRRVTDRESQIAHWQAEVARLEAIIKTSPSQKQLSDAQAEISTLRSTLQRKEQEYINLDTTANKQIQDLQSVVRNLQSELATKQRQYEDALNDSQSELQRATSERDIFRQELDSLRQQSKGQIQTEQQENLALRARIEQQNNDIKALRKTKQHLENENYTLKQGLQNPAPPLPLAPNQRSGASAPSPVLTPSTRLSPVSPATTSRIPSLSGGASQNFTGGSIAAPSTNYDLIFGNKIGLPFKTDKLPTDKDLFWKLITDHANRSKESKTPKINSSNVNQWIELYNNLSGYTFTPSANNLINSKLVDEFQKELNRKLTELNQSDPTRYPKGRQFKYQYY
jgi:chromosome segregation ATPase